MATAVLLVNLGTPDSPDEKDVRRYLIEFLTDPRVIVAPKWVREYLVRWRIVPKRVKESSAAYRAIWTDEGSPLMVYGERVKRQLQERLGSNYVVELAMRYQNPSIATTLQQLLQQDIDRLIVFPLFPQYASATTGSVHEEVMDQLKRQEVIPETRFVHSFSDHRSFISAFCAAGAHHRWQDYDHVLFSFHGLPEQQIRSADRSGRCLTSGCCEAARNKDCYRASCTATARALQQALGIPNERTSLCYQSRLGKDPWLQPYASDLIDELATRGVKRLLVFCPAFVADCLETIYEYGVDYAHQFRAKGGAVLDVVPSLNDRQEWIEAMADIVQETNR